jgi:hypothetical protein
MIGSEGLTHGLQLLALEARQREDGECPIVRYRLV